MNDSPNFRDAAPSAVVKMISDKNAEINRCPTRTAPGNALPMKRTGKPKMSKYTTVMSKVFA